MISSTYICKRCELNSERRIFVNSNIYLLTEISIWILFFINYKSNNNISTNNENNNKNKKYKNMFIVTETENRDQIV